MEKCSNVVNDNKFDWNRSIIFKKCLSPLKDTYESSESAGWIRLIYIYNSVLFFFFNLPVFVSNDQQMKQNVRQTRYPLAYPQAK